MCWGCNPMSLRLQPYVSGTLFASLNMANAYGPGGGYTHGMVAQEENMFRRTDCHFSLRREDIDGDDEVRHATCLLTY